MSPARTGNASTVVLATQHGFVVLRLTRGLRA